MTGLGIHTLRCYEHENLIVLLRNASNRRRYSEKDVVWIAFIKRLKAMGMPIKEIQKYAQLRAEGDATLPLRMEMLMQRRQSLNEQNEPLGWIAKFSEKLRLGKAQPLIFLSLACIGLVPLAERCYEV